MQLGQLYCVLIRAFSVHVFKENPRFFRFNACDVADSEPRNLLDLAVQPNHLANFSARFILYSGTSR